MLQCSQLTPQSYADSMTDRDFEHVTHFPVKLWDVVNDDSCDIFKWSVDGQSFFVDDSKYEQEIMDKYPGFVQISSFANLRRLLREYSFDWQNNETGEFQFSHPAFEKGKRDDIFNIRTKRKAIQVAIGQPVKPRRRNSWNGINSGNQSKTWIQPVPSGKVNLRVDTLLRFPEKFWAVVNDTNDLLYWGDNGDTVIVDDKKYEEGIMTKYPGFVQINSFANLRRLLREYGFSWSIRDNGFFEFSHSHMKKDKPDLLKGVKTKRKAIKAGAHHPYLPFYRGYGDVQFPHTGIGPKGYSHAMQIENFEQFDQGIARSSPEIEQAIGAIQYNPSDPRHFHHHHHGNSEHTAASTVPAHLYGFHPCRVMPSYSSMPSSVPSQNSWALQTAGEKIESPFFYPSWNQDSQLRLPIPCDNQSFCDEETGQTSPTDEAQHSNSEIRASSTGSSESVYASTSKGSPTHAFHEQLEIPGREETPPSFPLMHLQAPSTNGYSSPACLGQNRKCQAEGDHTHCEHCDGYQPNGDQTSCDSEVSPLNVKVESVISTAKFSDLPSSIIETMNEDNNNNMEFQNKSNVMQPGMNSNVFKEAYECRKVEADDVSNQEAPDMHLVSNTESVYDLSYHCMKKSKPFRCPSDSVKVASVK